MQIIQDMQNKFDGEITQLKSKNQQLTDKIESLETREQTSTDTDIGALREDVKVLSEVMETVERKSLTDKIHFGMELRTRGDWFDFKEKIPVRNIFGKRLYNSHHEEEVHGLFTNRFRLNMKADISPNLKFTGRLVMYKYWNKESEVDDFLSLGMGASRTPTDNELKVERAYIDYFFSPHEKLPMALTFGRLPTTDGMPTQFRDDTERKSVYPAMLFDKETDGVALSLRLDKLTGLKDSALSFMYARAVEDNSEVYRPDPVQKDHFEYYMAQFETMLPGRFFEDILLVLSYNYLPDAPGPNMEEVTNGLLKLQDWNTGGTTNKFVIYLQAEKFLGTNFDWFAGASYIDFEDGSSGATYSPDPFGLIKVNLNLPDRTGNSWYLGGRYQLPWQALKNPKIGVEYSYASEYHFGAQAASEDPLHKLSNQGPTWDFYYIQPITKYLKARLGFTIVKQDYVFDVPMLPPEDVSRKIKNYYFLLDVRY
jgi:hypothetical protein